MAVILTKTVYNEPYGTDLTEARIYEHGLLSFVAGSYIAGGLLPNWNPTTQTLNPTQRQNGENVLIGRYTQPTIVNITSFTVSGTTCVFSTKNPPSVGQWVTFSGATKSTDIALNGITAEVTAISAGVSFTCTITTTATTTTDTFQGAIYIDADTAWINSISGSGYTYLYNKANGTVQILTSPSTAGPLVELSAGALPAGVIADIIEFESEYVRL